MASKQSKASEDKQSKHNQPEETQAHEETESSKAIAADAQSGDDMGEQVDGLLETLQGDLSEIDLEAAIAQIDEWYNVLHKSKEPAAKELSNGLKELQKLLKSEKSTGHDISEVLIHIGEQTTEFAAEAEKGSKQRIQRLGKQLRQAGTSIAKAKDQEQLAQLDGLSEQMESGELTEIGPDEAVGVIDTWYSLLQKAEDEKFQQLADSLKELKQALKRSNSKPETIARILTQVGEQTTAVASDLPRGFKGVIKKLGKQMSNVAASLESAEAETEA
jgi:ABC-type transporter Mla subunit MlaD